jgi:MFS family permease
MVYQYIDRQRQIIKSFYTGIGKSGVIFPTAFLVALGHGFVTLGAIFYVRDQFGATSSQVGFFTALWSVCYILGCIFIRPLSNRVLPRYVLTAAAFFKGLFIFLILQVKTITAAYLFYGLFGLSISFFWPPILGWLSRGVEGARLGRLMSNFNFSWSVGSIISPLIAGYLSAKAPALPLYTGCFFFFAACLLLLGSSLTLPRIRQDRELILDKNSTSAEVDNSPLLRFPAWIGIFTAYTVIGVIVNIFPLYALGNLQYDKSLIGLLLLNRALFAMFGFLFMGRTTFWHFRPLQMLVAQGILVACVFFMRFSSTPLTTGILISCTGICQAFSYFNSMFHGISGSINRSGRMAVHESLVSSGLVLGSLFGGVLYQRFSMSFLYTIAAAWVLFGLLLQTALCVWIERRGKKTASQSPRV